MYILYSGFNNLLTGIFKYVTNIIVIYHKNNEESRIMVSQTEKLTISIPHKLVAITDEVAKEKKDKPKQGSIFMLTRAC